MVARMAIAARPNWAGAVVTAEAVGDTLESLDTVD
jgi:hypothetical protein